MLNTTRINNTGSLLNLMIQLVQTSVHVKRQCSLSKSCSEPKASQVQEVIRDRDIALRLDLSSSDTGDVKGYMTRQALGQLRKSCSIASGNGSEFTLLPFTDELHNALTSRAVQPCSNLRLS